MRRKNELHWVTEVDDDEDFPYVVREGEEIVCKVKRRDDAETICGRRSGMLREAGQRASDLRRNELSQRQLKADIRLLLLAVESVGQVLKLRRPRDIVRTREEIRKLLVKMKGRGYVI